MNHIAVTSASEYILALLQTHTQGTVHSVYRKTINLLLKADPSVPPHALYTSEILVALQASGSPLSPISLITELSGEQMAALHVHEGMKVSVSTNTDCWQTSSSDAQASFAAPDTDRPPQVSETARPGLPPQASGHALLPSAPTITVGSGCSFCVCTNKPANLLLDHVLTENELAVLRQNIRGALALRDAGSFELLFTAPERAGEILFLTAARRRLEEAYGALRRNSYAEAAHSLARLIGLGPGLTPAGDDFLCGVLAGFILCGLGRHPFARALRSEISAHLEDTNRISAAFLACALENQFSQAINELRFRLTPTKILHIFREIGHSSGTDSLCGVLFILFLRKIF